MIQIITGYILLVIFVYWFYNVLFNEDFNIYGD